MLIRPETCEDLADIRELVGMALDALREMGAAGCFVLGEPGYYSWFGFLHDPRVTFREVAGPYFQFIAFAEAPPAGPVEYHPAFDVAP